MTPIGESMMNKRLTVGFIGLGNMGGPMAANIAKAGYQVAAFDLRESALEKIEMLGVRRAASVAELAAQCDVICTCVLYDHQVRDIFLGADGIIEHARSGLVATIHSTVPPETVRKIAEIAKAKSIDIVS